MSAISPQSLTAFAMRSCIDLLFKQRKVEDVRALLSVLPIDLQEEMQKAVRYTYGWHQHVVCTWNDLEYAECAVSPNGKWLVLIPEQKPFASFENPIKILNLDNPHDTKYIKMDSKPLTACFSNDSSLLAFSHGGTGKVTIWHLQGTEQYCTQAYMFNDENGTGKFVEALTAQRCITLSESGKIISIYDLKNGSAHSIDIQKIKLHNFFSEISAIKDDATMVAIMAQSPDKRKHAIKFLDIASLLQGNDDIIYALKQCYVSCHEKFIIDLDHLAFSPTGKKFIYYDADNDHIHIIDTALLRRCATISTNMHMFKFNNDDTQLAILRDIQTSNDDVREIIIYDFSQIRSFTIPIDDAEYLLRFLPDNSLLFSSFAKHGVRQLVQLQQLSFDETINKKIQQTIRQ